VWGALGLGLFGGRTVIPAARAGVAGADGFGPLQPPDANGLRLSPGFRSRVVATSGEIVPGTSHVWHGAPDGGATFARDDDGWIYVSNSERWGSSGGVGALAFDREGNLSDAYSILTGTSRNCAGGPTPWETWLSCEEVTAGIVYECDPHTPGSEGKARPALGSFMHEAAAVDPLRGHVYLTEDQPNGLLYRFTPEAYPDLGSGTLEAAEVLDPDGDGPIRPGEERALTWHEVPQPNPARGGAQNDSGRAVEKRATRFQVPRATAFNGGEGCWYATGKVYFSTKGDSRVWVLDTARQTLAILYDLSTSATPILSNTDNIYASPNGDVYVAEDPGNLQIVALTPSGAVKPVVELSGHRWTEITGPALCPEGKRLYFSSQRNPGTTFEVTGPFAPSSSGARHTEPTGHPLFSAALAVGAGLALRGQRIEKVSRS